MSGQVHVASVRVESLPRVCVAFSLNGFTVVLCDSRRSIGDEAVRLRRGDRGLIVGVDKRGRGPAEALVVVSYPPYSTWPWRWCGDERFFTDLTAILDEFHYRA